MINLNHLALFHAVAKEGSVSRGAAKMMVSQPAVSKQLRQLEESLGVLLFDRIGRGVQITQAGSLLESYADRLFSLAEQAEGALEEFRGMKRGLLAIGATASIGTYLLPDVLVRFRRAWPLIQVRLRIGGSDELAEWLVKGEIALALSNGPMRDPAYRMEVLLRDPLVAIAPPGHPLSRKRSVTLRALCEQPFVVRETPSDRPSLAQRTLERMGMMVKPVISLGNTEAIKRAVGAGLGVALVSKMAVELELRQKSLASIRVVGLNIMSLIRRVMLRKANPSPSLVAFNGLLDGLRSSTSSSKRLQK